MEPYKFKIEPHSTSEGISLVVNNLVAYNDSKAERENYHPLTVLLRDSDENIVGGVLGCTNWRWLFISHFWISEHLRGRGYGQKLLTAAEQEAVKRGCKHAHLDTFSFQAREFYEKLGYEVFGILEDYPEGHSRIFLQKRNLA